MDFPGFLFYGDKKVDVWNPDEGVREYKVINPKPGFWVFKPVDDFRARIIKEGDFADREQVFKQKATIDVITVIKDDDNKWYCMPCQMNQQYVTQFKFPIPLYFAPDDLSILQAIQVGVFYRFGRRVLVYKDIQWRYPTRPLDEAREHLEDPDFVPRGREEERTAINLARDLHTPTFEKLVRAALDFVGAALQSIDDMGRGQFRVYYDFNGRRDSVIINSELTTLTAGICLSGRDRDYDVGSVILVKHRRND